MWGSDSSLLTLVPLLPLPSGELMFIEPQCWGVVAKNVGSGTRELALGKLLKPLQSPSGANYCA